MPSILFSAFSLKRNFKKLMSTETNHNLLCINGLRVLSVTWVILGHTVAWNNPQVFSQIFRAKHVLSLPAYQLLFKGYNSVENFFFISGMLTTYITLKYTEGRYEKFNIKAFILSRFIRLTPQMLIFILLTTLIPLLGSGPVWKEHIEPLVNNCYNNWWQNVIYLQNFIDAKNMCALHTWYIAVDMQYHFISLIVIICLHNRIRFGLMVNTIVIISFAALSSIIIYVFDFPPGYVNTAKSEFYVNVYDPMFYWKPWSHGSVYFIGLAFGYIIYKNCKINLSNSKKVIVWIVLLIGYIICIYDIQFWIYGKPYNRWISAFLYPTTRIIWALNTAILIWMCITGNGGFINDFLSWKAFIPLSRLTYSVYLTHAWIVWIYMGSKRHLIELNFVSIMTIFFSHLFVSYLIGFVFSLMFESVFLVLQNYLTKYLMNNLEYKESDVVLLNLNHTKNVK